MHPPYSRLWLPCLSIAFAACTSGGQAIIGSTGSTTETSTGGTNTQATTTATTTGTTGNTTSTGTTTTNTTTTGTTPAPTRAVQDVLDCNTPVISTNAGGINEVNQYSCANWNSSGPEAVFELTPQTNGWVYVSLSGLNDDLDLFLTSDAGGACDPGGCIEMSGRQDRSPEELWFEAVSGTTYIVVIDGWDGATSDFELFADCTP